MNALELADLSAGREAATPPGPELRVCMAAGCLALGARDVRQALEAASVDQAKGQAGVPQVRGTGCLGLCSRGPLVLARPQGDVYAEAQPAQAPAIVAAAAAAALAPPGSDQAAGAAGGGTQLPRELPFFGRQRRVVLEHLGRVDPERIEDYVAAGGYAALARALRELSPQDVIEQVTRSGLRGRGGAGYPTGVKWNLVAKTGNPQKYVVCNGDEGDPGAFVDRTVMEGDPHRVLEGMAIAAYAVGASQGYIYVRGEYPLAIERLQQAIQQAERSGVLGARVLETPFAFRIDLRIGAGAYVCGEETALIASIEGGRGIPRPRPPYPGQSGLWGRPTLINNVETLAAIPAIVERGGSWYAQMGTKESPGTKVFSLSGKIVHSGVIEVPFGITLRELIFDIGGGIPGGRAFKAVQTGGPSGGCIPAAHLDVPVAYETLAPLGSIVGSGGMVVMDDSTCMLDVARFFMEFCMRESCGKCIPCRAGTAQAARLLGRMTQGQATMADLAQLEELCTYLREASLCGLGQNAPNPVISTLRHFRGEYLAHIQDKVCPAGVCAMTPQDSVGVSATAIDGALRQEVTA